MPDTFLKEAFNMLREDIADMRQHADKRFDKMEEDHGELREEFTPLKNRVDKIYTVSALIGFSLGVLGTVLAKVGIKIKTGL